MPLPQRYLARCFDPTRRWSGRLRAALDATLWRVVMVESCAELISTASGSVGASPSQLDRAPALLLCVLDEATAEDAARWWSQNRERGESALAADHC